MPVWQGRVLCEKAEQTEEAANAVAVTAAMDSLRRRGR